jgi:copper chaperone
VVCGLDAAAIFHERNLIASRIMEALKLQIEGMSCEHCVRAVKNRLSTTPGVAVDEVTIGSARLRYDPARTSVDDIENAIADEGYTAFVGE